jgi:pimeloyl-ACP methyl ester carboxylesterase
MRRFVWLSCLLLVLTINSSLAQEDEYDPSQDYIPPHPLEPTLADLDAYECPGAPSLQCITLTVPLDPFRNDDEGDLLGVTFGIHLTEGERRGMLVVVVGGPGMAGIINGQYYLDANRFGNQILSTMDIVFFDQRGIGLSYGVDCPQAIAKFYQDSAYVTPYTPADEERLIQINRVYAEDCVAEMNADWLLPYLSTKFAVEDLAVFLEALGEDDPIYLYGESYGTQYAQTFATAYPERIKGLILDGVVDLTLSGEDYYAEAVEGGHKILLEYLNACNTDLACSSDMGRDAVAWYEELGAKIAASAINVEVRLPDGQSAIRVLDTRAYRAAMGTQEPIVLLRALAAATKENYEPLLRLAYVQQGKSLLLDEVNLPPLSSSSTIPAEDSSVDSEAAYNNVDCADYEFFSGSPDERALAYMRAGDELEQKFPYFPTDNFYYDLACPYWPTQGSAMRPQRFEGGRYPTFIINGTADRPTPISNGYRVFENVRNGFMITTRAGGHVNFGGFLPCPDQLIVDFIASGILPTEREYICDGNYFDDYAPLQTSVATDYTSALDFMQDITTEIVHQPEFLQVLNGSSVSMGCRYGGTMYAAPGALNFAACELIRGVALTGSGMYQGGATLATGDITLEVILRGEVTGNIRYSHLTSTGTLSIAGEFQGESVKPQP